MDLVTISKEDMSFVLWQGSPKFIPFLFGAQNFWKYLVLIIVFFYLEGFTISYFTLWFIIFSLIAFLFNLCFWKSLNYFLTEDGVVIKKGKKYYFFFLGFFK